jgi:hypothetical protein
MTHPYQRYESLESWGILDQALQQLELNSDIQLATAVDTSSAVRVSSRRALARLPAHPATARLDSSSSLWRH